MKTKKVLSDNFLKKFQITEALKYEISNQDRYQAG